MATIDVTKVFSPEVLQKIGADMAARRSEGLATLNPLETDMANAEAAIDSETARSMAENDAALYNQSVRIAQDKATGTPPLQPVAPNPVDKARENLLTSYGDLFEQRKAALQKQQTDNIRLAAFNSLGNALRTMVQPIGWAAGGGGFSGTTAGVQPYDNRQYLDAFNRAVKASDDLRNLGSAEAELGLKLAEDEYKRAKNEADYQKRRNESNEDFFARLDRQQKIKSGETYAVLVEKRRENAVKAFYTENARRISHKQPLISFTDFINLDGLGKEYYGNWTPTESEVQQMVQEVAAEAAPSNVETPAVTETVTKAEETKATGNSGAKPAVKTGSGSDKGNKAAKESNEKKEEKPTGTGSNAADRWKNYKPGGSYISKRVASRQQNNQAADATPTTQAEAAERWGGKPRRK